MRGFRFRPDAIAVLSSCFRWVWARGISRRRPAENKEILQARGGLRGGFGFGVVFVGWSHPCENHAFRWSLGAAQRHRAALRIPDRRQVVQVPRRCTSRHGANPGPLSVRRLRWSYLRGPASVPGVATQRPPPPSVPRDPPDNAACIPPSQLRKSGT